MSLGQITLAEALRMRDTQMSRARSERYRDPVNARIAVQIARMWHHEVIRLRLEARGGAL